jgi:hypothetical protein
MDSGLHGHEASSRDLRSRRHRGTSPAVSSSLSRLLPQDDAAVRQEQRRLKEAVQSEKRIHWDNVPFLPLRYAPGYTRAASPRHSEFPNKDDLLLNVLSLGRLYTQIRSCAAAKSCKTMVADNGHCCSSTFSASCWKVSRTSGGWAKFPSHVKCFI